MSGHSRCSLRGARALCVGSHFRAASCPSPECQPQPATSSARPRPHGPVTSAHARRGPLSALGSAPLRPGSRPEVSARLYLRAFQLTEPVHDQR